MNEQYLEAVKVIKTAILRSQSRAAKYTNKEVLSLYYSIGGYVSNNFRDGVWGTGAIEEISARLREELPGLRGFSTTNVKLMRQFYEAWQPVLQIPSVLTANVKSIAAATDLEPASDSEITIIENRLPLAADFSAEDFTGISFTHHMEILHKVKDVDERLFYIRQCARRHWNKYALRDSLKYPGFYSVSWLRFLLCRQSASD